jgi:hypothetical protein
MDQEIDRLLVSVRADTQGFARDLATMRGDLDGPFGDGLKRAGIVLESTLTRAIRTGKLGFDDLKRVALSVLADIASAAIRTGFGTVFSGSTGGGGLLGAAGGLLGGALGLPGRATGGPVSPGRAFLVGERGPEVFVPTSSGSVATLPQQGARDVRISIAINAPAGSAPETLTRSSRQVARAVRNALLEG